MLDRELACHDSSPRVQLVGQPLHVADSVGEVALEAVLADHVFEALVGVLDVVDVGTEVFVVALLEQHRVRADADEVAHEH